MRRDRSIAGMLLTCLVMALLVRAADVSSWWSLVGGFLGGWLWQPFIRSDAPRRPTTITCRITTRK